MKRVLIVAVVLLSCLGTVRAQTKDSSTLRVILVGTGGGPTLVPDRLGIGTLVVAGSETLLFDAGRGVPTGLARVSINPASVTKVFLTHLHSDHVISLPELYLYPWASLGRSEPLRVWGPRGTKAMAENLQKAFAYDIHVRRDVDEHYPARGIELIVSEIREGVVYESGGVKVTAFLVDHGPVKPAFGFRVDYQGHSVVLSGDTRPSPNLVKFARGTDLLIHEVGNWKQDPIYQGPPDEFLPNRRVTRRQAMAINDHHTDGVEAGRIFAEVKPKLAVFSHGGTAAVLPMVRQNYSGPVEVGEDGMTLEIADTVTIRRFQTSR